MPKFRVTLSDGRIVTLEADSQPSESDVLAAIGSQPKSGPRDIALPRDAAPARTETPEQRVQRLIGGTDRNSPDWTARVKSAIAQTPDGELKQRLIAGLAREPRADTPLPAQTAPPDDYGPEWDRLRLSKDARTALNEPLARPTGVESIDSLTSPASLITGAVMGGPAAVRGVLKPGLTLAGRAASGAAAAGSHVAPVVKYEAAKQALQAVGVPEPAAVIMAMGIAGYKRGAKPPAEAPRSTPTSQPASPTAAAEPPILAPDGRPWGTPKPTVSLDQLRARLDVERPPTLAPAPRSTSPAPAPRPAPDVAPPVESAPTAAAPVGRVRVLSQPESFPAAQAAFKAAGLKPGPAELNNTTILMGKGKSADEAMRLVVSKRATPPVDPAAELAARLGTPSDAARDARIDLRNAKGELKSPSAATAKARRAGTEVVSPPIPSATAVPFTPMKLEQGLTGEAGYVYHATNAERAAEIAAGGKLRTFKPHEFTDQEVWPDGSVERRAYFVKSPEHAYQFAPETGQPVVLRTKANPGVKRESTGDLFVRKPVPAKDLEILGTDGKWHRLTDVLSGK